MVFRSIREMYLHTLVTKMFKTNAAVLWGERSIAAMTSNNIESNNILYAGRDVHFLRLRTVELRLTWLFWMVFKCHRCIVHYCFIEKCVFDPLALINGQTNRQATLKPHTPKKKHQNFKCTKIMTSKITNRVLII